LIQSISFEGDESYPPSFHQTNEISQSCVSTALAFQLVEVKNVNVVRTPGLAEFPDCVSTRALKHLDDLAREAATGARAVLLFVIQRDDCMGFAAAADLDPAYASRLAAVAGEGVEILCYACDIKIDAITLSHRVAWRREI
jgi:sugar fermentation stimulation protein A